MEEQQQKEHEELITVTGGVELEVAYQNNGEKEIVKVRQIPVSKIGNFIMALANEAEAIELYCDKPKGWADTLSIESASAIADKGQEINLPFFVAWFRRQAKWRDSQQTGAIAEVEKKLQALSSASAASAQQSPTTTDSPLTK
jgi:hypothetical protein